jgi:hypothetical protein
LHPARSSIGPEAAVAFLALLMPRGGRSRLPSFFLNFPELSGFLDFLIGEGSLLQFQDRFIFLCRFVVFLFEFLLKLIIESKLVMLFEVRDDLIGIEIFLFEFLMVAAALEGIPGSDVLGHSFIKLVASE